MKLRLRFFSGTAITDRRYRRIVSLLVAGVILAASGVDVWAGDGKPTSKPGSAAAQSKADETHSPIRRIEFSGAPELRDLAERVRKIANENYPKICAALSDGTYRPPRQFDIIFKPHVDGEHEAATRGTTIYLSTEWLATNHAGLVFDENSPTNLEQVLVHEMGHVAQQYGAKASYGWTEGVADYVRYKLGYTNGWACPQCSEEFPHYSSGYWCAGAFLLYVDQVYGSRVIRKMNGELHKGSYSDEFFTRATGRSLADLWADFQKTPAFKPSAVEANRIQFALGYVNGKPPKDIDRRYTAYVRQTPGGTLTLEALDFLKRQVAKGELPGFAKNEKLALYQGEDGSLSFALPADSQPEIFPAFRLIYGYKAGGKTGSDQTTYHYVVVRHSEDSAWRVERAWRGYGERSLEEFACETNLPGYGGNPPRAWLGIAPLTLGEYPVFRDLLPEARYGVLVNAVLMSGPAAKSDLRPADVITAVDGKPVVTVLELKEEMALKQPGQEVTLDVVRQSKDDSRRRQIVVKVDAWQPTTPLGSFQGVIGGTNLDATGAVFGLKLGALSKEALGMEGVLVTRVEPGSLAESGGVKAGDVITSIGGIAAANPMAAYAELKKANSKKGVLLNLLSPGVAKMALLRETGN